MRITGRNRKKANNHHSLPIPPRVARDLPTRAARLAKLKPLSKLRECTTNHQRRLKKERELPDQRSQLNGLRISELISLCKMGFITMSCQVRHRIELPLEVNFFLVWTLMLSVFLSQELFSARTATAQLPSQVNPPNVLVTQETNSDAPEQEQDTNPNPSEAPTDSDRENIETLNRSVQPSIVTISVKGRDGDELSVGTGFVIAASGRIVTNAHVIGEGRAFTVELRSGRTLPVLSIESMDSNADLAVIQVDVGDQPLKPIPLSDQTPAPGVRVAAFGNPLGLRNSVVEGVVSAVREVQGRDLIQLAMPTQPGNSGGPLVDLKGEVRGIINMKSAIDDNLGFAIPVAQLIPILNAPHPVQYTRWVTLGQLDPKKWQTLFGATWRQTGGLISAEGAGNGFGGRSLCLYRDPTPQLPIDVTVDVRLDDESGAAGIAFFSDGGDQHYGFYPSNGNLRLTCFKGPSVYSWEVLADRPSKYYRPGEWNRLRVRLEKNRLQCFVNDELVVESNDQQLKSGAVGLVKFRDTNPSFRRFAIGEDLASPSLSKTQRELIDEILLESLSIDDQSQETLGALAASDQAVSRELRKQASLLEIKISQMRRLADDVKLQSTLSSLRSVLSDRSSDEHLLRGALWIAKLDNEETDPQSYVQQVERMAEEIAAAIPETSDPREKRQALDRYLFEENGFHGGRTEYYHPANSHLDRVIDDREGLPITLSILYMELAKRIGLNFEGVGLPGHFVVRHVISETESELIDVFERGRVVSQEETKQRVISAINRPMMPEDVRPQSDTEILIRVLNNLLGTARRNSDTEAYRRYCEALVSIMPDEPEYRIMRSQARAMTERYSGAIDDVDWLIERIPEGANRDQARRLKDSLIADQERRRMSE